MIDQSRVTSFLMKKTVQPHTTSAQMEQLARETCVSEAVHNVLALCSLHCLRIWPGAGGVIFTVPFIIFGQLRYSVIQRYNRPRFLDLAARLKIREQKRKNAN